MTNLGALIRRSLSLSCPVCNEPMPRAAASCPQCGAVLSLRGKRRRIPYAIGAGAGATTLITVVIVAAMAHSSARPPSSARPSVGTDVHQLQLEILRLNDRLRVTEGRLRSLESHENDVASPVQPTSPEAGRLPESVDSTPQTGVRKAVRAPERPARDRRDVVRDSRAAAASPPGQTPAERQRLAASPPALGVQSSSNATRLNQVDSAREAKGAPSASPAVGRPEPTRSTDVTSPSSAQTPQQTTAAMPIAEVSETPKPASQAAPPPDQTIGSPRQTDSKLAAKFREDWRQMKESADTGAEDLRTFFRNFRHMLGGD